MKKRLFLIALAATSILVLSSCKKENIEEKKNGISIICTSDVHADANNSKNNNTYSNILAFRDNRKDKGYYTSLVDCGDYIQGGQLGILSQGEYLIDIMNEMEYDVCTVGNHEFDYGIDRFSYLSKKFNGSMISCNLKYIGDHENKLDNIGDYKILEYGDTKVGFIGVTTPEAITKSTPAYFMEDGEFAYSFGNESKDEFYSTVQTSIDTCKSDGADYVVLLAHLGYGEEYGDFSSLALLENISGIDAMFDGHSHKVKPTEFHEDKDGNAVPLACLGTKLSCFGEIIIDDLGLTLNSITSYPKTSNKMESYFDTLDSKTAEKLNEVVATSDTKLSINDSNGVRLCRNSETTCGNFVADMCRYVYNTDIGFINGGGVRSDLPIGNITYGNLLDLAPYYNKMVVIEATGQQILDYLEFGACKRKSNTYAQDGTSAGEFGGFVLPSGLKYSIDTSIESSAIFDSNGILQGFGDTRRVKDVYVLKNNSYQPIDVDATYTIGGIAYPLLEKGDGNTAFDGCNVLVDSNAGILDIEGIIRYINEELNGNLSTYSTLEGRITII